MEKLQTDKKPLSSILLIGMHLFLGIGAIFGGGTLILDPRGDLLRMPISLLDQSPFDDFLIPGMILFLVLGVMPMVIAYSLITRWQWKAIKYLTIFKNLHWSWNYSLYTGFVLIIWISVQVFMIQGVGIIHLVYIALGISIQFLTLLPSVQKYYKTT